MKKNSKKVKEMSKKRKKNEGVEDEEPVVSKKKGRPRKEEYAGPTEEMIEKHKKKNGKKTEEIVKEVNFKRAKKDFQISTKNASWKEIKSLSEELLKTIKSFVWDISDSNADVDKLSEFLLVQILYHCISADVLDQFPGMYKMVCTLADRYPVAFDLD
jgi:hypothetical protein